MAEYHARRVVVINEMLKELETKRFFDNKLHDPKPKETPAYTGPLAP